MEISKETIERCKKIVNYKLEKKEVYVTEDILIKITEKIINIAYSKGGYDSSEIIGAYADGYIDDKLYLSIVNNQEL